MLVQDQSARRLRPKRDDGLTLWDRLPKIGIMIVVFFTAIFFIFIRNTGDTAALICLENVAKEKETIPYPNVEFRGIERLQDTKSRFAIVKSERWIVVAALGHPTDEIRRMSRLRGWQVVAVGDASTPPDWNVKGAIYLSVDEQAKLGYRIVKFMPYDSYVRKSVGYLFAMQHGAKKIYDADERGSVIKGNLAQHFDLELIGEDARRETLLQYIKFNRSVVNPYIHFGQRSVWPRGMPLEEVGNLNPEDYYGEVFRGKQYIQQGIANGLPDVDSVFYFTRKSGVEAFDISFDSHAHPVALPQGLMAPLNSFNTLFHSPAFCTLMLPVSISTMASDIIRGFWAQRILWEVGGIVAFYPPTVYRPDRLESYPFTDEKDLHVNVGRLVKFLMDWRSSKPTLFDKILELSHSMALEGFWNSQDVALTAAWLQDLLAVGYMQPRLMSLELDSQGKFASAVFHGDHKEFVPLKLPSVHLGVEEVSAVNFEIGNLIRWRKFFGNVVLVLHCSGNVNHTALTWKMIYGRIFKSVVVLSEQSNPDLGVEYAEWWQVYKAFPKVFERYTNAEGFMFLKDNTILNYWNLFQANKTKLWITDKVSTSWKKVDIDSNSTAWYFKNGGREILKKVVGELPVHFQMKYRENMDEKSFVVCSSEVFYIPRQYVGDFVDLVSLVGDQKLHHEVAIPLFFLSLDTLNSFESDALSHTVYKRDGAAKALDFYTAEAHAVHPWKVTNQTDFVPLLKAMSKGDPLLLELL